MDDRSYLHAAQWNSHVVTYLALCFSLVDGNGDIDQRESFADQAAWREKHTLNQPRCFFSTGYLEGLNYETTPKAAYKIWR